MLFPSPAFMFEQELYAFEMISRHVGERFDWVQAGGGNTSVKLPNGELIVKASGVLLSQVQLQQPTTWCRLKLEYLHTFMADVLRAGAHYEKPVLEKMAKDATQRALFSMEGGRPSIETLLHALLHRYTAHTHPIVVNAFTALQMWEKALRFEFPHAMYLPYHTPGVELALALYQLLKNQPSIPDPAVVFLQNHGLLVSGSDPKVVLDLTEAVTQQLEGKLRIDLSMHRQAQAISQTIRSIFPAQLTDPLFTLPCLDREILSVIQNKPAMLRTKPFCPDVWAFCGEAPFVLNVTAASRFQQLFQPEDLHRLKAYYAEHNHLPRVILLEAHGLPTRVFVVNRTLQKCHETEELLRFHVQVLQAAPGVVRTLPNEELHYFKTWEAEQYRQNL